MQHIVLENIETSSVAFFVRYGYDAETKSCRQFVYGGCLGNNNRFKVMMMDLEALLGGSIRDFLPKGGNF